MYHTMMFLLPPVLLSVDTKLCFLISSSDDSTMLSFAITATKRYISVVTLSTQDNVKVLDQLKSVLKKTINWNKYHSKPTI